MPGILQGMITFLVKVVKDEASHDFTVPGHSEIQYIEKIDSHVWMAKDTMSSKNVIVKRNNKGKFCEYEIEYLGPQVEC